MKNYGYINDSKSLVTKKYVDDRDITTLTLTSVKMTLTYGNANTLQQAWPTFNQDTTGNAATATQLKTARTLWGRSFNGTADITGDISSTGHITPAATDTFNLGSSSLRYNVLNAKTIALYGSVTYGNESHLSDLQIQLFGMRSNSDTVKGWHIYSWEDPYYYPMILGGAYASANALVYTGYKDYSGTTNNCYWGIATNDPLYLLHVNGSFGAASAVLTGALSAASASLTGALSVGGLVSFTNTTDYSASGSTVSAALKVSGGVHIGKILHVANNSYIDGSLMIANARYLYCKDYAGNNSGTYRLVLGINSSNDLLLGYLDSPRPNYNTYIDGNSIYIRNKYTANDATTTTFALSVVRNTVSSSTAVRVGVLTNSPQYSLHVNGTLGVANGVTLSSTATIYGATTISNTLSVASGITLTTTKRIYFGNSSHYLELDGNGYLHTNVGFYSDSWVASGGIGSAGSSGGGGVNVNTYAQIQAGTATGVASENSAYVPTSYALRQTYATASGLSTTVTNLRAGGSHFTALLMRNTNNSPTITFQGEYDNTAGANITLGTISGYKQTISSVAYSGLSVGSDLFIPNGKHIYTYTYGGAVRSVVYYPTANYNELRFGDSAGVTNILGSSVQINSNTIGSAAYCASTTSFSETAATLPTCAAINTFLNSQINPINNAVGEIRTNVRDILAWKKRPVATEMTVSDLGVSRILNLGGIDVWCDGSVLKVGGSVYIGGSTSASYKLQVAGTCYFDGATTINNSLTLQNEGVIKLTPYNGSATTVLSFDRTPNLFVGNSTKATYLYGSTVYVKNGNEVALQVKGKQEYNLTEIFRKSEGSTIASNELNVTEMMTRVGEGRARLYVSAQVTINGTAYTQQYDVIVGSTTGANISMYYAKLGSQPPITFEIMQIGYSNSAWKVLSRISKAIN